VLINNRGGGIFEHLPIAQFDPPFEEFFATPQEADFAKICGAHGVAHAVVGDWDELIQMVSAICRRRGIRVLEIRTTARDKLPHGAVCQGGRVRRLASAEAAIQQSLLRFGPVAASFSARSRLWPDGLVGSGTGGVRAAPAGQSR
jgi:hypothetical protein